MNAELLLAHYERIADAPDAIQRMRRFVLDLAVRGRLVPQDPGDEPAWELAKRIAAERTRLSDEEQSRRGAGSVTIARDDLPFHPPTHWKWAKLIHIARTSYGFAFPSGKFNSLRKGMPLIRIRDISSVDTETYFDGEYDPSYVVTDGDYLIGMDGNFNLRRWRGKDGLLNQRVLRLNEWRCGVVPAFVALVLESILGAIHGITSQTTVKHLSAKQVSGIEVPLAPLAEQGRIVAKVNELMALCDQLEAARAKREAKRDRLAAASLARLSAPSSDTFHGDARFALETLPALTARRDQIKQLRQTILNLAVRGKLVPQDPNDEPARAWLRTIGDASDKLSSQKTESNVAQSILTSTLGLLPVSWLWVSLGQLVAIMDAGWSPQCESHPRSNTSSWGVLKTTSVQVLAFDCAQHKELPSKFQPRPQHEALVGDILVTRAGPKNRVGISCVVDKVEPRLMISDKLIRFRLIKGLSPRFFALALNASPASEALEAAKSGMAVMQMNISQEKLRAITVPFPPVAEQHRIVAKVDQLMALCDQLEGSLATRDSSRSRLLDAMLHEALRPASSDTAKVRPAEKTETSAQQADRTLQLQ